MRIYCELINVPFTFSPLEVMVGLFIELPTVVSAHASPGSYLERIVGRQQGESNRSGGT